MGGRTVSGLLEGPLHIMTWRKGGEGGGNMSVYGRPPPDGQCALRSAGHGGTDSLVPAQYGIDRLRRVTSTRPAR